LAVRKKTGHGSLVTVNSVAVAKLKSFKWSGRKRDLVEVTCMDDAAVYNLDSDPPDYGEIEFTALWDMADTDTTAIESFFDNDDQSERDATVVFSVRNVGTGTAPTASTWTYNTYTYTGRITEIVPNPVESKTELSYMFKMKVNAKPTKA
jgi:hypothetical protein